MITFLFNICVGIMDLIATMKQIVSAGNLSYLSPENLNS
jgi:hypothetical protein